MTGGSSLRNCSECGRAVHNFADMSDAEIARIIFASTGRICGRVRVPSSSEISVEAERSATLRVTLRRTPRWASAALGAALGAASLGAAAKPAVVAVVNPTAADHRELIQIQTAQGGAGLEVVEVTGAVLANAKVTAVNRATGAKVVASTNARGQVSLANLPAGDYRITVESSGFETLTMEEVRVPGRVVLSPKMGEGFMIGEVNVTSEPPIEPQPTSVSGSLTPPQDSTAKPNVFRRFFSAVRKLF
jgi:hypothetical protein